MGSVAWALVREEPPRSRSADLDRYVRQELGGGDLPHRSEHSTARLTESAYQASADEGLLRRITQVIAAFF